MEREAISTSGMACCATTISMSNGVMRFVFNCDTINDFRSCGTTCLFVSKGVLLRVLDIEVVVDAYLADLDMFGVDDPNLSKSCTLLVVALVQVRVAKILGGPFFLVQ